MRERKEPHSVILIHPPVIKPSEAPVGIGVLSAHLSANNVDHEVVDANLEGLLYLLEQGRAPADTWTRRAAKNLARNLAALRAPDTYQQFDRYKRAVLEINRLLETADQGRSGVPGLADYSDAALSPLRSDDLLAGAERHRDNPFYPYFEARLTTLFEERQPSLVGFSLNYLSQALCTFAMIGFIRERFSGLRIALGGSLVTSWLRIGSWPASVAGAVDHVADGPGETLLLSLSGVYDPVPAPLPAYERFPMERYLSPGPIVPYSTSRGCYWGRCSFCPENAEGVKSCQAPPASAVEGLDSLADRYSPALLHLCDNALSPALLRALSDRRRPSPWYGFTRITHHLTEPDFCTALRTSGCVMLKLGIESGDQGVLDGMNKGTRLETISAAIKAVKGSGIGVYGYLLFGTPYESAKEAERTLSFVRKHADFIDFLNVAIFNLPRTSTDALHLETYPFYDADLSLYTDFRHPEGWDRRAVRRFLAGRFRRDPAIRAILNREPPIFTSNHAPFFLPRGAGSGLLR